jgi:hypothetical protein
MIFLPRQQQMSTMILATTINVASTSTLEICCGNGNNNMPITMLPPMPANHEQKGLKRLKRRFTVISALGIFFFFPFYSKLTVFSTFRF